MTKEEAIYKANHLRKVRPNICVDAEDFWDTVISALEQEPCDDCIRRSDIGLTDFEMVMCNGDYKEALKMLLDKIEKAPSVTSAEKVGQWIDVDGIWFKCSECGAHRKMMPAYKEYYCPNCGAKMQEVKE